MIKFYKFFAGIFILHYALILNGQTIGETLADSNAYRIMPTIEKKVVKNSSFSSGARMSGPILMDQGQLINNPNQGFGGANVSSLTGQFFGINANTSGGFILADDFIIPNGEMWTIDSIIFFNYQTGSSLLSTINDLRVQIRKGSQPGVGNIVFGNLTTNVLHSTYFSGIYRALSSNLTAVNRPIMVSKFVPTTLDLNSGTYWLEHQVNGSLSSGPFSPLRTLSTNHEATGNGYQFNNTWDFIYEFDSNNNNPVNKGITFIIYGTSTQLPIVAQVYGIDYYSLQDAIDAVSNDGDDVLLLDDITESEINITNYGVTIKAGGNNCQINNLNIHNGKYLRWHEDTLTITSTINNYTSGTLINNAVIVNNSFINTGIYRGGGNFVGQFTNQNLFLPGN